MVRQEPKQSPEKRQPESVENGGNPECVFSPRFKSVAALAGWDEEALLIASLVVEDTPDRESKQKKRTDLMFKTPPSNSRRKRRNQRRSPAAIPVTILDLDEGQNAKEETERKKVETKTGDLEEKKAEGDNQQQEAESSSAASCSVSTSTSALPCMDRLREELSCAICLEICFEPSTTPCGHSFCKKCLRSAADKCGKRCPKCRQMISNGRSCTVNTVLWNTIQLLFPEEVEARKAAGASSSSREANQPKKESQTITRSRNFRAPSRVATAGRDDSSVRRRRGGMPSQNEDAALALRLQREEFMEAFGEQQPQQEEEHRNTVSLARANLRAMASRAVSLRARVRPYFL